MSQPETSPPATIAGHRAAPRGRLSQQTTVLQQIWTVAHTTFRESIRQPIYLVVLLTTVALLALSPAFSTYTLEEDDRLLVDVGLNAIFLGGVFLSSFTAAGVLSEEIRRRTVLSIVSKPIGRAVFLIGKFLGVCAAIAVAHWIWSVVFVLTLRHGVMMTVRDPYHLPVLTSGFGALGLSLLLAVLINYFLRKPFASTFTLLFAVLLAVGTVPAFWFDPFWEPMEAPLLRGAVNTQLLLALVLAGEALAILCALAVSASTRLSQYQTLAFCLLAFFLGLVSEFFLGQRIEEFWLARAAYALAPNLQFVWLGEALMAGTEIGTRYLLLVSCYGGLYIAAVLSVGVALFQTRDVG